MKKLATLIGTLICLSIMKQPKSELPTKTINNYFIKSGCGGSCGGHCRKCGGHR